MIDLREVFLLNPQETVAENFGTPAQLINVIVPNLFIIAGIILFFLLLFGGFSIITSQGDPKATEKGSQAIVGALVGFLIVIASYWLIQIIEVVTGVQILNSGI